MKLPLLSAWLAAVCAAVTVSLPAADDNLMTAAGELVARYGQMVKAGDREGLIALYSTRGTFLITERVDGFKSAAEVADYFRAEWAPPADFAWDEMIYQAMPDDVVVVHGSFRAKTAEHPQGVVGRFSATLVRESGDWKIRSETRRWVATEPKPLPEPASESMTLEEEIVRERIARRSVLNFARAYEPVQLGFSRDEGDELFLDFTLSLMFPVLGGYWNDLAPVNPRADLSRFLYEKHLGLFVSGTVRGGQYIAGRPSAPVVGKRFNPQLFARWWIPAGAKNELSEHRYLDLIYGHESNGQFLTTESAFNTQREMYRLAEEDPDSQLARDRSYLSARSNLSRGWDYVGVDFSWPVGPDHSVRVKAREFLPYGLLQRGAEQSHVWEGFGPTRPRRQYDGLMIQFSGVGQPIQRWSRFLTGRYVLTYTTGLSHPTRHNTFQLDLGAEIFRRPLSLWLRYGYNSDLVDYFQHDLSGGVGVSIWAF